MVKFFVNSRGFAGGKRGGDAGGKRAEDRKMNAPVKHDRERRKSRMGQVEVVHGKQGTPHWNIRKTLATIRRSKLRRLAEKRRIAREGWKGSQKLKKGKNTRNEVNKVIVGAVQASRIKKADGKGKKKRGKW